MNNSNPSSLSRPPTLPVLPDRSVLVDKLDSMLRDPGKVGGFSVCVIDIDQIHSLGQSIGPAATTELLARLGARLKHGTRSLDTVVRMGPSTFAILLRTESDETVVRETMQRLLLAISTPVNLTICTVSTTASIGIALSPVETDTGETLLQKAAEAMSVAKSQGGDSFCFYSVSSRQVADEWRALSEALREAISHNELVLQYQPKLDLRTGQVTGYEALLRWQHPVLGLITPDRFLLLAEELGLIVEFNQWVIRHVLRQLRTTRDAGDPELCIALNLSLRHFRFGDLAGLLAAELTAAGVASSLLEVEIGENSTMRDPEHAVAVIDRIRALGVRVTLDQFGTGLSSLSYLSRLGVAKIKIDRAFVRDITSNPANASVVAAIIALAHALGKKVCAVGVETEGQALQLQRYDCDEIQGFLFSKSVGAGDLKHFSSQQKHLVLESKSGSPRQRSLLLVDDEPSILNALKRLLRNDGYKIFTADSGQGALDILATHTVQVIVSDQRMPGMTGIELLSRVRELYPDTRRLILSGYSDVTTLSAAINQGAVWKFISKPWDDEALIAEIRHAFELAA
jgi:diguanylate cyclase (GGDEF)-like protein